MGTVAVDSEELERLTNEAHKAVLLQEKLNSLESLRTSEAERAFAMDLSVRNAGASLTKTLTDILGSLRRHSLRTVTWLREENLPDGSDTGALCAWLVTVFAALPSMAADNARRSFTESAVSSCAPAPARRLKTATLLTRLRMRIKALPAPASGT